MTPHRTETLAGYAIGSVRSATMLPADSATAVGAAVAVGLGWAFGAANVGLLWVVLGAMVIDLMVGAMRAVVDPLQTFSIHKLYGGLLGKIFRILFIPTASLVDWLFVTMPIPLPDGYEQAYPVTAAVMVALAMAEIASATNKFREAGVAPGAIAVVMRHLDRIKLGGEPPVRRSYDPPAIAEEQERRGGADG